MHYEYWIAPDPTSGGDVTNASAWRRPFRDTVASTGVFAPALTTDTHHVWASGPTGASALPIYRVAGIRAPANGEFSTREFEYPNEGLWINGEFRTLFPVFTPKLSQRGCWQRTPTGPYLRTYRSRRAWPTRGPTARSAARLASQRASASTSATLAAKHTSWRSFRMREERHSPASSGGRA